MNKPLQRSQALEVLQVLHVLKVLQASNVLQVVQVRNMLNKTLKLSRAAGKLLCIIRSNWKLYTQDTVDNALLTKEHQNLG